jgi:O-antigen/teichoic acid export membrane protein
LTSVTEGLGIISYGMAFLTYALLFANPGLTTIGAREIAKNHNNHRIIEEILGLRLMLASLIFLLFIIGLIVIPGKPITKNIIFFYLLSLFPFAILLEFIFQGREEMGYIGISRLVQYSIYVILLFVLLKISHNILMVPISFFIGYCAGTGILIFIFLSKYKSVKIKFSLRSWHNLLIVSFPVGLAVIFNQVSLNLPPIILGVFHSKVEVGVFSAGFKIIIMLLIIERVFHYVFFPVISKQFTHAPEKLRSSFTFLTRLLFAIRILLLYFLVAPVNTIFGYGLVSINQERRFFKVITYTALINLILIIILGINFKGQGAAVALFVSETIAIVLMNRELKKFVKFKSLKYIIKPFIASLIMGIVLYALKHLSIIILVILGIIIYSVVFYLIKGFSKEEIRNLKQTFVQK